MLMRPVNGRSKKYCNILLMEKEFFVTGLCVLQEKILLPFPALAKADKRQWNDLVEEFKAVRKGTELLFKSFDEEQLNASGISNNHSNYVLAFGYIAVGHSLHHMKVISERYL